MTPIRFKQANCYFGPPPEMDDSQVQVIHAFQGEMGSGNLDGSPFVVTAWQPTPEDLEVLKVGGPVFLTFLGGLPPHRATTTFEQATHPTE